MWSTISEAEPSSRYRQAEDPIFSQSARYDCEVTNHFGLPTGEEFIFYHDRYYVQANWIKDGEPFHFYLGTVLTPSADRYVKQAEDFIGKKAFGFRFTSTNNGGFTAVARAILFSEDPADDMKGEFLATTVNILSRQNPLPVEEVVYSKDISCKKTVAETPANL